MARRVARPARLRYNHASANPDEPIRKRAIPHEQREANAMRAVWYDRQGPANEVIVTGTLPTPEPGVGQLRVRLEASGVNPSDTYRRRGAVPAEYPRVIPNSDGAGVIDKAGEGVPQHWVGKRVWLYN